LITVRALVRDTSGRSVQYRTVNRNCTGVIESSKGNEFVRLGLTHSPLLLRQISSSLNLGSILLRLHYVSVIEPGPLLFVYCIGQCQTMFLGVRTRYEGASENFSDRDRNCTGIIEPSKMGNE
jgi:hypothetical protein